MKHTGKHSDRKVVVLYRQVPGEDHMALVVYSDVLPRMIHDEVMKALESPIGQNSNDFADVLFRTYMQDGRIVLTVLHKEGMIKKVPTNQILMTPNAKSSVRLDELNSILNEMAKGEEAIKRLQEIDQNRGMTGKARKAEPREVGMPVNSRANALVEGNTSAEAAVAGVLSDADLAKQRLDQANKMRDSAESLLAEAARLETEAQQLSPTPAKNVTKPRTKKAPQAKKQEA